MNHFEDLWNESELLSSKSDDKRQAIDIIKSINQNLKNLAFIDDSTEKHYLFGMILFEMCILSRIMNINSYTSLNLIINKIKNKNISTKEDIFNYIIDENDSQDENI